MAVTIVGNTIEERKNGGTEECNGTITWTEMETGDWLGSFTGIFNDLG